MPEQAKPVTTKYKHGENEAFERLMSVGKVLVFLMFAVGIYDGLDKSGWLPRNREVKMYTNTVGWINGESKMCFSYPKDNKSHDSEDDKSDISELLCNDSSLQNSHMLKVRFWGSVRSDRFKLWKCERADDSITCKLQ
jgi:hypothetical protein